MKSIPVHFGICILCLMTLLFEDSYGSGLVPVLNCDDISALVIYGCTECFKQCGPIICASICHMIHSKMERYNIGDSNIGDSNIGESNCNLVRALSRNADQVSETSTLSLPQFDVSLGEYLPKHFMGTLKNAKIHIHPTFMYSPEPIISDIIDIRANDGINQNFNLHGFQFINFAHYDPQIPFILSQIRPENSQFCDDIIPSNHQLSTIHSIVSPVLTKWGTNTNNVKSIDYTYCNFRSHLGNRNRLMKDISWSGTQGAVIRSACGDFENYGQLLEENQICNQDSGDSNEKHVTIVIPLETVSSYPLVLLDQNSLTANDFNNADYYWLSDATVGDAAIYDHCGTHRVDLPGVETEDGIPQSLVLECQATITYE